MSITPLKLFEIFEKEKKSTFFISNIVENVVIENVDLTKFDGKALKTANSKKYLEKPQKCWFVE